MEMAWHEDEVKRFSIALHTYNWKRNLRIKQLEYLDRQLPEYKRPLVNIPKKRKLLNLLKKLKPFPWFPVRLTLKVNPPVYQWLWFNINL